MVVDLGVREFVEVEMSSVVARLARAGPVARCTALALRVFSSGFVARDTPSLSAVSTKASLPALFDDELVPISEEAGSSAPPGLNFTNTHLVHEATMIMRRMNHQSPSALMDDVNKYITDAQLASNVDQSALNLTLWSLVIAEVARLQEASGEFDWRFLRSATLDNKAPLSDVAHCGAAFRAYCLQALTALQQLGVQTKPILVICVLHVIGCLQGVSRQLIDAFWECRDVFLAATSGMSSPVPIVCMLKFMCDAGLGYDFRPLAQHALAQAGKIFDGDVGSGGGGGGTDSPRGRPLDLVRAQNAANFCRIVRASLELGVSSPQLTDGLVRRLQGGTFGANLFAPQAIFVADYLAQLGYASSPAGQMFFRTYLAQAPDNLSLHLAVLYCWLCMEFGFPIAEQPRVAVELVLRRLAASVDQQHMLSRRRPWELRALIGSGALVAGVPWRADVVAWLDAAMRQQMHTFGLVHALERQVPLARMGVRTPHGHLTLAALVHSELSAAILPWPRGLDADATADGAGRRVDVGELPGIPVGLVLVACSLCVHGGGVGADEEPVSPTLRPLKEHMDAVGWGLAVVPYSAELYRRPVETCMRALELAKRSVLRRRAIMSLESPPPPTAEEGASR